MCIRDSVRPQPEAKAEPEPEAKASPTTADADAAAGSDGNARLQPEAEADVAALLSTTFGDVLVTGLLKDPEDAGRLIAQGIIQTKARIAAARMHETPTASEPEPTAKTPPAPAPKTAD